MKRSSFITHEGYIGNVKRSFGERYYSFDGERTWTRQKRAALRWAIDHAQAQSVGMIRVSQDGQPDQFRAN